MLLSNKRGIFESSLFKTYDLWLFKFTTPNTHSLSFLEIEKWKSGYHATLGPRLCVCKVEFEKYLPQGRLCKTAGIVTCLFFICVHKLMIFGLRNKLKYLTITSTVITYVCAPLHITPDHECLIPYHVRTPTNQIIEAKIQDHTRCTMPYTLEGFLSNGTNECSPGCPKKSATGAYLNERLSVAAVITNRLYTLPGFIASDLSSDGPTFAARKLKFSDALKHLMTISDWGGP